MRFFLVCCLCGFICPAGAQVINQNFALQKRVIQSVLVLPPQVSVSRLGMKGGEGMTAESDEVADLLYAAVCRELASRGAAVSPIMITAASKDEERYALADIERKYNTIAVQMYKRPGKVKSGRYSMGDSVVAWPPAARADTLVFVHAGASVVTRNRQAFAWATLLPKFSQMDIRLGFVDARSGDIVAFGHIAPLGNATKKSEDALQRIVQLALTDLPLPSRAKKAGH